MKNITIVSCCLNEAKNIERLYSEIDRVMNGLECSFNWDLLLVDDGSTDDTELIAKRLIDEGKALSYLKLTKNFGKEIAITAGLDHCATADAVVLIDADLQHPVDTISHMIDKWLEGYDQVVGVPKLRTYSKHSQFFSKVFHKLINKLAKSEMTTDGGDFRLLSNKVVQQLNTFREKSRYMKGLYEMSTDSKCVVYYDELNREEGESQFSLSKRFGLALNAIVSFTTTPIRFFTLVGILILCVSFIYLLAIIFEVVFYGKEVPGFASLMFSIVVLNGVIMLQVGLQGEYIAQILKEVKNRPIYFVEDFVTGNKSSKNPQPTESVVVQKNKDAHQ